MLVPGRASRVILGAGFRHQDGKEEQPADRNGGEIEEADWIAEPLDDKPAVRLLRPAPMPTDSATSPCARLNRPVPRMRSAAMMTEMTLKSPAATPSSSWIATTAKGLVLKRANSTPRNGNTPSMTRKMVLRPYPASSAALSRSVSTAWYFTIGVLQGNRS